MVLALGIAGVVVWAAALPGEAAPVSVGLVVPVSDVDDDIFSLLCYRGLQRAETELGVTGKLYASDDSGDWGPNLQQCADEGNDLCISVGFSLADLTRQHAELNPGTDFAVADWAFDSYLANLRGIVFADREAGYMAGTLAGLMTQSDVVGVVGGIREVPSVLSLVEGYQNGAQCANPLARVLIEYAGTFVNPELGAEIARRMIGSGADVIFVAAGPTGTGAILAATEAGVWGIGVDIDYYDLVFEGGAVAGSDKLLSSAVKRVDNAVFATISDVVAGTFTGGEVLYGLAVDAVGLAPFHEADASVPQGVRDQLDSVKQGIIGGTIDIFSSCRHEVFLPVVQRQHNSP
jgi:basic membrane lipoprotein Med (substrate-binding protein (PBP1-ABC) superfamily)